MKKIVELHPFSIAVFVFTVAAFAMTVPAQAGPFLDFVEKRINTVAATGAAKNKKKAESVCAHESDQLARRVFADYGSMFVAAESVQLPSTCIFREAEAVEEYQDKLDIDSHRFGAVEIELQRPALEALKKAVVEAAKLGLTISPLDGRVAGRRGYEDTVRIWNSRFHRALNHWSSRGKIRSEDAERARTAPVIEQTRLVINWEKDGLYFSTNFSKSIFYSVAPPGTSQHLSLLAFDVVEAGDPAIRRILNKNGWYQTIRSDQPHFTFLGVPEDQLPSRGLQKVLHNGNVYLVPLLDQPSRLRVINTAPSS